MVVRLKTISSAGATDPDEFQWNLQYGDLSGGSSSDFIVLKALIIQQDSFVTSYPYKVPHLAGQSLENIKRRKQARFLHCDSQAMRAIINKSNYF